MLALPPSVREGLAAIPPGSFSSKEIKHVVLVMQENRSFGHDFGTLPGVRSFADPTAIKLASTGKSVLFQPGSASPLGYLLPCHLDTQNTGAQAMPSTDHSWKTRTRHETAGT